MISAQLLLSTSTDSKPTSANACLSTGCCDFVGSTSLLTGIKQYFERALGKLLLYRFERLQYVELNEKDETKGKNVCDIYGAEHLLRLFGPCSLHTSLRSPRHSHVVPGCGADCFVLGV